VNNPPIVSRKVRRFTYGMTSSARNSSDGGMGQAQHLGGLEVDDQLELGGLLDGQITRSGTPQYLVDIRRGATKQVGIVWSVGHKAASPSVISDREHSW
jgi:hypothetical protein